ncbi:hypothetical protein BD626DRAFT_508442 [Schizophyllum amplum]|uniref:Chromatin modification-related protein n=1 Tax=Schizophyllum amplum TaxID=97359 RepID=A0A550C3W4_9AGAR|nr:hypothetical protein BD626DRAFT_508442 [Auriculariopsis ampla]
MPRRKSLRNVAPESDPEINVSMHDDEEGEEAPREDVPQSLNGEASRGGSPMNVDEGQSKEEKEQAMWDAFREEYFETIEQMPLHLQRHFTLMKELEQQAQSHQEDLLPMLRQYIARRHELAGVPNPSPVQVETVTESQSNGNIATELAGTLKRSISRPPLVNGTSSFHLPMTPVRRLTADALSTPRTPNPFGIPPERAKTPQTTKQMLSHLAWLSEEIVRASEEKVNIAQAAYDSVERHIHIIEQAIKEQEESITLGLRPGTRLAPMLMPDAPQLVRPTFRDSLSPPVVEDGLHHASEAGATEAHDEDGEPDLDGQQTDEAAKKPRPRKTRGRISMPPKKRRQGQGRDTENEPAKPKSRSKSGVRPRKVTLLPASTEAIDEPRYCTCNGISAGTMVACDNSECPMEWFHLPCVGLENQPPEEEKWYCPSCRERPDRSQVQKPPPTRRHRR